MTKEQKFKLIALIGAATAILGLFLPLGSTFFWKLFLLYYSKQFW